MYSPDLSLEQKVDVLETVDLVARFEKVVGWARETLADLEVRQRIQDDVTDKMERKQREYILRQQLEAIRKELAEVTGDEGDGDALADYRRRAETLPETVRTFVVKEIDRLERTGEQSPEQSWIRTWLDRILELPWNERSEDRLDLEEARAILDADHTGLVEVKDRIIEQLAVRKLRKERGLDGTPPAAGHPAADGTEEAPLTTATPASTRGHGAILALVGPPVWARPRWASPSHGRWVASSCGSPSAASGTRPRSAATAAPTSAPSRAASPARSRRPGR